VNKTEPDPDGGQLTSLQLYPLGKMNSKGRIYRIQDCCVFTDPVTQQNAKRFRQYLPFEVSMLTLKMLQLFNLKQQ